MNDMTLPPVPAAADLGVAAPPPTARVVDGTTTVQIDASGTEGPFFVRRLWLAAEGRQETWEEFGGRVRDDHLRARKLIEDRLHRRPLAYAPPLQAVFNTAPISATDWAVLTGFGVLLLAAEEARKAWLRRTPPHQPERKQP